MRSPDTKRLSIITPTGEPSDVIDLDPSGAQRVLNYDRYRKLQELVADDESFWAGRTLAMRLSVRAAA